MPIELKLKDKYRDATPFKKTKAKGGGNSGGVGKHGHRRAKGWRKHGTGPANVPR